MSKGTWPFASAIPAIPFPSMKPMLDRESEVLIAYAHVCINSAP